MPTGAPIVAVDAGKSFNAGLSAAQILASKHEELAESLYRLIDLLGKADKSLILLYLDKIPYDQIAEIVGISEAAARKRVERIKQKLVILNTENNGKDI